MAKISGMSSFLESEILNHVLRGIYFSGSSSTWVALYSSNPTEDDTGTELSGSGYQRAAISGSLPFDVAYNGDWTAVNTASGVFPQATGDWGWITHFGIMSGSQSGSLLFFGNLTTGSLAINSDDIMAVPAGQEQWGEIRKCFQIFWLWAC
jgi:hypothetical protein